ncbi:replication restart helicase PriA [Candidatus Providencia siddallii]|uniref:Replication restart protein PriA n=1 Tax=Candidatus Providencia siddallii TaxID=1715285 RepID=A0ABP1CE97_9GAMM
MIIQIALSIPLNYIFNYQLQKNMPIPVIGSRVIVPFKNNFSIGIVIQYKNNNKPLDKKIKKIKKIIDFESIFSKDLWKMLLWSSKYYYYPIGKILFYTLPKQLQQGKKINYSHTLNLESLNQKNNFDANKQNYFQKEQLLLNNEQKNAIKIIKSKENQFSTWLLTGTKGSGKIKVCINILKHILSKKKQALILTPEIKLANKIVIYLKKIFDKPINLLHSKLNNYDKLNVWLKTKLGHNSILIGTRSALLSSFYNLGVIIINEEHDYSYKQQNGWKYHARDLAIFRAKLNNIPIIMTTETPSFETLYNVKKKKYHQLNLTSNIKNINKTYQYIIDLKKQQIIKGISNILIEHIKKHITKNKQIILLLNKLGYSSLYTCYKCNWIAKCKFCNNVYTFYKTNYILSCYKCNKKIPTPQQCPNCKSNNFNFIGIGTEQLEEIISKIFPNIGISRIDQDTKNNKNNFKENLNIKNKKSHIFIGTKILTKNIFFANVTFIAILDIDHILFSNDFRTFERFAQFYIKILNQIIKEKKHGEICIQTNYPEHPLLIKLLKNGYFSFSKEAMKERKIAMLPPYTNHILILSKNNNKNSLIFLENIKKHILKTINDKELLILGPIFSNQKNLSNWQILLQHTSKIYLQKIMIKFLPEILKKSKFYKIKFNINVDPIKI